jgi:ribosome-binding factor A
MDPHRGQRLAQALREQLSEILNFELEDPRLKPLDVAAIELSPDLRLAVVRILLEGTAEERAETLEILTQAKGHIRRQLTESLDLFRIPDLRFEIAAEAGSPARVEALLKRIRRGRSRPDPSV